MKGGNEASETSEVTLPPIRRQPPTKPKTFPGRGRSPQKK